MIQLRQVSRYVYDVFAGTGWPQADAVPGASNAQWTRVRKQHWGLVHVVGERLNRAAMKQLQNVIDEFPQGSLNPIKV